MPEFLKAYGVVLFIVIILVWAYIVGKVAAHKRRSIVLTFCPEHPYVVGDEIQVAFGGGKTEAGRVVEVVSSSVVKVRIS